jgi:threonine-phosphate decarboxylase
MIRLMPRHGGNIYRAAEKAGIPAKKVLDFSASINPLGTPATAIAAISRQMGLISHYPQPFAEDLSLHIGEHFKVNPDSVICGNGSNELIYLIPRCLKPTRVLVTAPTFSEYERACVAAGAKKISRLPLKSEQNFDIDPDLFVRKMTQCDMAFLCNPNNPTGRLLENRKVLKIADAARECGCYLIVDEAFIDFASSDSVLARVKNNPRLIVIRSMTKFYALAGLRIGFGVVPEHLVAGLEKYREPWTVNTLAQAAVRSVLSDRPYQEASIRNMEKEKQFLEKGLKRLGITWYPSSANFYLLHVPGAQAMIRTLEAKGILVRDCSDFHGLDNSYIRIAVRTRRENKRLLKELSAI